jgi:hypothetical protein
VIGQTALPDTGRSANWLANLIEAAEVVAASPETCDPAILTAFSYRLGTRITVRPLFDLVRASTSW